MSQETSDGLEITYRELDLYVIGQSGAEEHHEDRAHQLGYRAVYRDGVCGIVLVARIDDVSTEEDTRFHAIRSGGSSAPDAQIVFDWVGTPTELASLVARRADPLQPSRIAMPSDHMYPQLMDLYHDLSRWCSDYTDALAFHGLLASRRAFTVTLTMTFDAEKAPRDAFAFREALNSALIRSDMRDFRSVEFTGEAEILPLTQPVQERNRGE